MKSGERAAIERNKKARNEKVVDLTFLYTSARRKDDTIFLKKKRKKKWRQSNNRLMELYYQHYLAISL